MQTNGQHFKASYDGPIELDDYTSMGGGGYAVNRQTKIRR